MIETAINLSLGIAERVRIEFEGQDRALQAKFVGMEPPHYMVFRLPTGTGAHEFLYEGSKLIIKYVSQGKVYGFKSEVSAYLYKKGLIILLIQYPSTVEKHELREMERVRCYIPSTLTMKDTDVRGCVLDISPRGSRFGFTPFPGMEDLVLDVDIVATLTVPLLGMPGRQAMTCSIRSIQRENRYSSVGLRFEGIPESIEKALDRYMEEVMVFIDSSPH